MLIRATKSGTAKDGSLHNTHQPVREVTAWSIGQAKDFAAYTDTFCLFG